MRGTPDMLTASIEDSIGTAVRNAIWGPIDSFISWFTDPFWAVLGAVVLIIAAAGAVRWFFGSASGIWPGVVAVAAGVYAWAFRKGQQAERNRKR